MYNTSTVIRRFNCRKLRSLCPVVIRINFTYHESFLHHSNAKHALENWVISVKISPKKTKNVHYHSKHLDMALPLLVFTRAQCGSKTGRRSRRSAFENYAFFQVPFIFSLCNVFSWQRKTLKYHTTLIIATSVIKTSICKYEVW